MILIEGHWENVDTLEDISRVIRQNYNSELADELDKIIWTPYGDEYVHSLENIIENIRDLVG